MAGSKPLHGGQKKDDVPESVVSFDLPHLPHRFHMRLHCYHCDRDHNRVFIVGIG